MSRCVIFYRGVDGVCQSLIIPNLRPFGRIGGISGDSRVRAGRFIVLCRYGIIDFPSFDKRLLNLPPPVEESLVPLESCVLFELLDCPELLEPSVLLSDVFPLQEPNPDAVPSAMTEHSKKTTTFFFIFFLLVPRRFLIPWIKIVVLYPLFFHLSRLFLKFFFFFISFFDVLAFFKV